MPTASYDPGEQVICEVEALLGAGRAEQGLQRLRDLLERAPLNARLWHRAADLLGRSDRPVDAVFAQMAAVALAPDCLVHRLALAAMLCRIADFAQAIAQYETAAILAPLDLPVLHGLASACLAVGLFGDAARACRAALAADGANDESRHLLKSALARHAPQPDPQTLARAQQACSEGVEREAAGQTSRALEAFRCGTRLLPGAAPAHYRLGCLLQDCGQHEAALAHHRLAARLQPDLFGAAHNAGKLAASFGLVEDARRYLTQAQQLRPRDGISIRLELLTAAVHDSPETIALERARIDVALDRIIDAPPQLDDPLNKADLPTFYLAYHGRCNRELHAKLARAFILSAPELTWQAPHCLREVRRPGRIRVGFISQFMRNHSIGKVARGFIAELNRDLFEVYVINIPPSVLDDTARWIRARADHNLTLASNLCEGRAQIAALELDILFYQDIGMEPFSYFLAFARLAKVQCVSFGHPDTTGIPNMDYYVSNDLYEPDDAANHYTEQLIKLHELPTLAYYFRPPVPHDLPTRTELGLPSDARLYICPQTPFKLHPDFDDLIRGILERDAAGRVLLFSGSCLQWSLLLRKRFNRVMPEVADRITFLPRQPYLRYMQFLSAADVVLDTPHFNGMITSLDALATCTPIVTLPTALQRGRVTQAMYRTMGIDDGVAHSADEYTNMAVDIATNADRRHALRSLIAERNPHLFEDRRTVGEFERFFMAAHAQVVNRPVG